MEGRHVAVNRPQITAADLAFAELMKKTETYMNDLSQRDNRRFFKMNATKLEACSCDCIKEVCSGTQFKPEDIVLVSGHSFPDIVAQGAFGVEIKSTEKDHWTSVGSSIVESTRNEEILNIYMLFGKLGGNPPAFKCRPYQDVLKEIAVTHSPRYQIDMELSKKDTIFSKMGVEYDDFRRDENKIEIVRQYYREKAKRENKSAIPWWLSGENTSSPVTMNVMRKGMMGAEERLELTSEMLILFPEVINSYYDDAAVWLCTRRNTINPSFRDLFSAGGTCIEIDGEALNCKYPHIVGTLLECNETVKDILSDKRVFLLNDIRSTWHNVDVKADLYSQWINKVEVEFQKNVKLNGIDIAKLLRNNSIVTKYCGSK